MFSDKMDYELRRIAECAICMGTFFDTRILICGHSFCLACLQKLPPSTSTSTVGITCPECRLEISLTAIGRTKNLSIEAFVKELNSTNATPATFPTSLPLCRGCCKRYPPQELKRCKDHDECLCYMCAAFGHRQCTILALNDFATMKLHELRRQITGQNEKLNCLQHDHVDAMQKILDEVNKFQSDLRVLDDCFCVDRNVFQPLIQQFSDMLTEFTELQVELPDIAPLKCSTTEVGSLKAELDALQIEYLECNPVKQKLDCMRYFHAKVTETSRAAQEIIDHSFTILTYFENVIQTVQDCPKRTFILMVSAAELFGINERMRKLDDNLRAIKNYADTCTSEYIETEPYCAPTVKSIKQIQISEATRTSAQVYSVELKEFAVIEDTTSKVLRKKGKEIVAFVKGVVTRCKSVNEAPRTVMTALCAAEASFPITNWMIWTFEGFSSTWYHIDGAFTNGSHFAISCHGLTSLNEAVVAAFLKKKITQYSHLQDSCGNICRDALKLFGKGKWSCIKGVTGSVFIECNYDRQQIISITNGNYDYVIWVNN